MFAVFFHTLRVHSACFRPAKLHYMRHESLALLRLGVVAAK